MATVTLPVTEDGIVIPRSTAHLLGCRAGGWVEVDVRPLPSDDELRRKAISYALRHLGDAVCVGDPVWVDDGWQLDIRIKGRQGTYGRIFLSPRGEVVPARTTSRLELLQALNAEDSSSSTAQ